MTRPPAARSGVVMVVEDDSAVREVVREVLAREGHRVIAAAGPTEVIQVARKLDGELDLLVTDVIMPAMNGHELFDELVRQTPRLSVLFMSGYSGDAISENGLLEPGIEFTPKPLSIEALRQRVRLLLAKRDQPR